MSSTPTSSPRTFPFAGISRFRTSPGKGTKSRRPERVGRVDAEDLHVSGEEGQLLESPLQRQVLWMSVDLGEELGRGEVPADHVALQLGHVHAVGREATERL